jgi:hypothetical protein
VYSVETETAALDEVAALPPEALPAYAELMSLLQVTPWSGDPHNLQRPDANMRTHTFGRGAHGLAIYLVLEADRQVVILRVLWTEWRWDPTGPWPISHLQLHEVR